MSEMITIILFLLVPIALYFYLVKNYSHWTNKGVKGPTPSLVVGNTPNFLFVRKHLSEELNGIYE